MPPENGITSGIPPCGSGFWSSSSSSSSESTTSKFKVAYNAFLNDEGPGTGNIFYEILENGGIPTYDDVRGRDTSGPKYLQGDFLDG